MTLFYYKPVQMMTATPKQKPHIATLIMMAAMSALAINMFLPSLPGMAVHFDVSYAFMQLAVALFLTGNAVLQLFIGPLADKYGRRPVLLWGIGIFCFATVGCLLSPNAEIFMAFRLMQATISVSLVMSRAIVRDLFPQDQAASMLGYVTMGMSIAPMLAPAAGGGLDMLFGWKATFVVLLMCGAALLAICWKNLPETAPPSKNTLAQQFAEYPDLLTSQRFWSYALTAAFSSGAFFAYMGGAPYVATEVFGMTAQEMGFYFATPGIGYFFGNWVSGAYSVRLGANRMVLIGSWVVFLAVAITLLFSLFGVMSPVLFFGVMVFVGFGNGVTIPNATAGMLSARPKLVGTASGLGSALMIGGGAAWSAMASALLARGGTENGLLGIMTLSSFCAVICILWALRREKQIGVSFSDS